MRGPASCDLRDSERETASLSAPGYDLAVAIVASWGLVSLTACGVVDSGDQWFDLAVHNDTSATVVVLEPCPNCRDRVPGPLATLRPGAIYQFLVLANGGPKTYVVTGATGDGEVCLTTAYETIPTQTTVELSAVERPCQ
jgi:hypothetical protein